MKRIMICLLLASLLAAFPPARAERSVSGRWYGNYFRYDDKLLLINRQEIFDMQLFFSEDGAVQLTLDGMLLPGRWVYDPDSDQITLSLPDDTYTVSFGPEDELLMVFSPEETIVLTREELDTGLLFQPVSASGKEDFSGNWVAVYYALNKGWFSLNGLEEYMAAGLVVADETFSLVVAMDGSALPQYDASFTFSDGKLELLPNNHPSLRIGEVVMTRGGFLLFPFTIAGAGEDSWIYLAFEKDSAD